MSSASTHPYSLPPPPMQAKTQLPSLKDLNFQYRSPVDAPPSSAGASSPSVHGSSRREWSRPNSVATNTPPADHHYHPQQKQVSYTHESTYHTPPISHPSPVTRDDSHPPTKRARSTSTVMTQSPAPHTPYPPPHTQYPPPSSFQIHAAPPPPPHHDQPHHAPPYHGYIYPPPYVQHRPPLPHMPPHVHHLIPPGAYPQPPLHWPPPPPHIYPAPAQFINGFPNRPLVPANLDPRQTYPSAQPITDNKQNVRQSIISEIATHCRILYDFADRYAQLQHNVRHVQPRRGELADMAHRAADVVRLLGELKKLVVLANSTSQNGEKMDAVGNGDDHRPPKRPWEEISKEPRPDAASSKKSNKGDKGSGQAVAEKDMEIIRSKRAATTSNTASGQPKSKYRKRSRASPPGKCHSCSIRETPEWRRGPDGARTLCNACGLHFAKLVRKRDKQPEGEQMEIDLEMLRASTAQARGNGTFGMDSPPPEEEEEKEKSPVQPLPPPPPPPPQPQPQQQLHIVHEVTSPAPPPPVPQQQQQQNHPQQQHSQQHHQQQHPQQHHISLPSMILPSDGAMPPVMPPWAARTNVQFPQGFRVHSPR